MQFLIYFGVGLFTIVCILFVANLLGFATNYITSRESASFYDIADNTGTGFPLIFLIVITVLVTYGLGYAVCDIFM